MFSRYWICFRKWILPALAVGLLVYSSFTGPYSLCRIYHFRKQRDQIRSDILHLSEKNGRLRQEIEKLRSEPEYISRIAREELGLVKAGEIIYRYHRLQKRKQAHKEEK